jgi:hypothetical protein
VSKRPYVRRKAERYTVSPFNPPANAVRLGEYRMEPFVRAYQFGQQFSAATIALSHRPQPTLLDLAVSAYLQGIEDTVQSCTTNGFNFSGGGLNGHQQRGRDGDGSIATANRGATREANHQGNRSDEPDRTRTTATRRDGPHDGLTEFALSMW